MMLLCFILQNMFPENVTELKTGMESCW